MFEDGKVVGRVLNTVVDAYSPSPLHLLLLERKAHPSARTASIMRPSQKLQAGCDARATESPTDPGQKLQRRGGLDPRRNPKRWSPAKSTRC
jgi:hypothetical protein